MKRKYLFFVSACLLVVAVGTNVVWTSPIIWKLKSNDTSINPLGEPVTTFQIALIAGLFPFGGLIGPLFLTKFCDIIGRRKTLIMLSATMLMAVIGLAFSTNLYSYYIMRFVIGFIMGGTVASTSIFLNEISEDHNRGMIGCFIGLSFPLGNLYAYLVGPMFSIKIFTLLCTIPNIINLLCLLTFIPESPYYLLSKGDREGTIKALERIRRKNPSQIEKEYETIQNMIRETGKVEPTWKYIFSVRSLRKGFIIAIGLNIFQQISGICAILAFAGPIFDEAGASLSGDLVAILIGIVKLASVLFAATIIERVGRRPLLIASTLGGSVPHFLLGLFFYLKAINAPIVEKILWLPIISVLGFVISYAVGLGVIPAPIMSELFPSDVKSKAASTCSCIVHLALLVVTAAFPILNEFLGSAWCLWLFALCEFLGFLFVYFVVPEIKGKSLTEVQEMLSK